MKKIFFLILLFSFQAAQAKEIPFSLIFTGDLHSSFEPRSNPHGLGGVARLKTALTQLKNQTQEKGSAVLQLDAGIVRKGPFILIWERALLHLRCSIAWGTTL